MEIVTLDTASELYHGSVRLYSIQCYIKRSKPLLQDYLAELQQKQKQKREASDEAAYIELTTRIKENLHRYAYQLPKDENQYLPWTFQVIFLKALEDMRSLLQSVIRVSTMLKLIIIDLSNSTEERDEAQQKIFEAFLPDYHSLILMVERIENCSTLEEASKLLELNYFSVMRQPIQFFGDFDTALTYGKGENQVYQYRPSRELKMLNISDRNTIELLMEPGQPFSSFTAYSERELAYYTQKMLPEYRASILTYLLLTYYERDEPRRAALQSNNRERKEKLLEEAHWNRFTELSSYLVNGMDKKKYAIAAFLQGRSYSEAVEDTVAELQQTQPLVFQEALSYYNVTTPQALIQRILKDSASIFDLFLVFEHHYRTVLDALQFEEALVEGEWLDLASSELDKYFVVKSSMREAFNSGIQAKFYDTPHFLKSVLGKRFFEFFEYDIASPKGLWLYAQWDILHGYKDERLSLYVYDTMLVRSFLTADLDVDGWYCSAPEEIMVIEPAEKGEMVKLTDTYNTDTCVYDGEADEDNFLDSYA